MVRREAGGLGEIIVLFRTVPLEDMSVVDEFALDVPIVGNTDPLCLEGGGGGGALKEEEEDVGSSFRPGLGVGISIECWDDMVKDELLRDLVPIVVFRNCECLRASGTGGGTFFCAAGAVSKWVDTSAFLLSGISYVLFGEIIRGDDEAVGGVGGSGLFVSESCFLTVGGGSVVG